jgi:hypothetical protein
MQADTGPSFHRIALREGLKSCVANTPKRRNQITAVRVIATNLTQSLHSSEKRAGSWSQKLRLFPPKSLCHTNSMTSHSETVYYAQAFIQKNISKLPSIQRSLMMPSTEVKNTRRELHSNYRQDHASKTVQDEGCSMVENLFSAAYPCCPRALSSLHSVGSDQWHTNKASVGEQLAHTENQQTTDDTTRFSMQSYY